MIVIIIMITILVGGIFPSVNVNLFIGTTRTHTRALCFETQLALLLLLLRAADRVSGWICHYWMARGFINSPAHLDGDECWLTTDRHSSTTIIDPRRPHLSQSVNIDKWASEMDRGRKKAENWLDIDWEGEMRRRNFFRRPTFGIFGNTDLKNPFLVHCPYLPWFYCLKWKSLWGGRRRRMFLGARNLNFR